MSNPICNGSCKLLGCLRAVKRRRRPTPQLLESKQILHLARILEARGRYAPESSEHHSCRKATAVKNLHMRQETACCKLRLCACTVCSAKTNNNRRVLGGRSTFSCQNGVVGFRGNLFGYLWNLEGKGADTSASSVARTLTQTWFQQSPRLAGDSRKEVRPHCASLDTIEAPGDLDMERYHPGVKLEADCRICHPTLNVTPLLFKSTKQDQRHTSTCQIMCCGATDLKLLVEAEYPLDLATMSALLRYGTKS